MEVRHNWLPVVILDKVVGDSPTQVVQVMSDICQKCCTSLDGNNTYS